MEGCWFCKKEDGDLCFSLEFDCYFHMDCLQEAIKEENPEALIIGKEFNLDKENVKKLRELLGEKMTLKELDDSILEIIGGGISIFEYDKGWWGEYDEGRYAFSYLDEYNVYFDVISYFDDPYEWLVEVIDVDEI